MSFEPQKFFIGLVDFFAVWLPGALLVYLLKDSLVPTILGVDNYNRLAGNEGWAVFLFTSYLVGHFIFLIGSSLLDDQIYDRIRKATEWEQISRLSNGKNGSNVIFRYLARILMKSDDALRQAIRIKEECVDPRISQNALNVFQWSKAKLVLNHPAAMESIQRFEADSKFFRSLVVVCLLIIGLFFADAVYRFLYLKPLVANMPVLAVIALLVAILAFLRYVDQRLKATNQAYMYILTLENKPGAPPQNVARDGFTHAGGVVFRKRFFGQTEYLLVATTNDPKQLVLPKGHIEPGELAEETAVREVHEEAGIWAKIAKNGHLGSKSFKPAGDKYVTADFFLMEYAGKGRVKDKDRKHFWQPIGEPFDEKKWKPLHEETKQLILEAGNRLGFEIKTG
jgi:ADP-ribose pyrophosphatase YjhB (NUDIX family)